MISRLTILLLLSCSTFFVFGQAKQQKTYPLAVRFISIGTGVPDKKPVIAFIQSFKKKNRIKEMKMDTIGPLGKEGEYAFALPLTELTKKQKVLFIQQIKKISKKPGDPGQIQYEENVSFNDTKMPGHGKPQTIKIE